MPYLTIYPSSRPNTGTIHAPRMESCILNEVLVRLDRSLEIKTAVLGEQIIRGNNLSCEME